MFGLYKDPDGDTITTFISVHKEESVTNNMKNDKELSKLRRRVFELENILKQQVSHVIQIHEIENLTNRHDALLIPQIVHIINIYHKNVLCPITYILYRHHWLSLSHHPLHNWKTFKRQMNSLLSE